MAGWIKVKEEKEKEELQVIDNMILSMSLEIKLID